MFYSLCFTFKSMNNFEFESILYKEWDFSSMIFFSVFWDIFGVFVLLCLWTFNCSSVICWKGYPFSTDLILHLCRKSIVHTYIGLFLGSLFSSIVLRTCLSIVSLHIFLFFHLLQDDIVINFWNMLWWLI